MLKAMKLAPLHGWSQNLSNEMKDFYKSSDLANLFWNNITAIRVDWFQYKSALAIGFNISLPWLL